LSRSLSIAEVDSICVCQKRIGHKLFSVIGFANHEIDGVFKKSGLTANREVGSFSSDKGIASSLGQRTGVSERRALRDHQQSSDFSEPVALACLRKGETGFFTLPAKQYVIMAICIPFVNRAKIPVATISPVM
jgi:hypothetical protein